MAMKFSVTPGSSGAYSWHLHSSNGQQVAWAGETFASKSNADRAAESFKAGAAAATFEIYADAKGEYRWRAKRGGNVVASSGEAFSSESNANRAAENVRDNAGGATGP